MLNAEGKEATFSVSKKTKGKLPSLPFGKIKDAVLGRKYELSLLFAGKSLSKRLSRVYIGINKPTNVLSFSLSKTSGEVIIDLQTSRRSALRAREKLRNHIAYLFIHALLHLKGYAHGSRMEELERKFLKKFRLLN